jgi:hypothetical protein
MLLLELLSEEMDTELRDLAIFILASLENKSVRLDLSNLAETILFQSTSHNHTRAHSSAQTRDHHVVLLLKFDAGRAKNNAQILVGGTLDLVHFTVRFIKTKVKYNIT